MINTETSWPGFLDLLDTDPDTGFRDFYRFTYTLLRSNPPKPMRSLNSQDQEDMIGEIIYHCTRDNFRVLKKYTDKGKPFAAWFYAIAYNKVLNHLRDMGSESNNVSLDQSSEAFDLQQLLPNPQEGEVKRFELAILENIVREVIGRLDEYCQLLLKMAADEFTPREMVASLRLPKDQNKKISDDLRECRRKLKKKLSEKGYDLTAVFQS